MKPMAPLPGCPNCGGAAHYELDDDIVTVKREGVGDALVSRVQVWFGACDGVPGEHGLEPCGHVWRVYLLS